MGYSKVNIPRPTLPTGGVVDKCWLILSIGRPHQSEPMNGVRISLLALFEFDTNHGHVPIAHHPTDDNAENLLKSLSREAFLKKSEKNGLQAM